MLFAVSEFWVPKVIMFSENDFITFIIFHSDTNSARKMTSGSGVDKSVDSVDKDPKCRI